MLLGEPLNGSVFGAVWLVPADDDSGSALVSAVADGGDVDHDGQEDIVLSAPGDDDGEGAVYLFLGADASGEVGLSGAAKVWSGSGETYAGVTLAGGDLQGDSEPELLLYAPCRLDDGEPGRDYLLHLGSL